MKMKRMIATIISAAMMIAMASTAFAGTWKTGATRTNDWWYENEDGSYASNGWYWIDGNQDGVSECYYFDADGWMLAGTTTPDGYQVNENGAWTVDGAVQTKGEYKVVNAAGENLGTVTSAELAADAAKADQAPAEITAPVEQATPAGDGDLTKAATIAGVYVGQDEAGNEVRATVVANADGGVTVTVQNAVATYTDPEYHYEATTERGVCWGFETADEKGGMVINSANQIDLGWILNRVQ